MSATVVCCITAKYTELNLDKVECAKHPNLCRGKKWVMSGFLPQMLCSTSGLHVFFLRPHHGGLRDHCPRDPLLSCTSNTNQSLSKNIKTWGWDLKVCPLIWREQTWAVKTHGCCICLRREWREPQSRRHRSFILYKQSGSSLIHVIGNKKKKKGCCSFGYCGIFSYSHAAKRLHQRAVCIKRDAWPHYTQAL